MRTQGSILVIRGGAIGDFILTTPALRALREQFPETQIELLGYPHIAQLALQAGLVDAVRSIEARPLASFFARGGALSPELSEYFGSFGLILSYLYDPDLIFQTNVRAVTRAQFIVAPHRPDEGEDAHAADVFLTPLEKLAIFEADAVPELNFGERAARSANAHPLVAVHPGSGSERKNWPLNHWVSLIEKFLVQTSASILIVGGEADTQRVAAFAPYQETGRVRLLDRLPLVELARELQLASAFVGHDSGITHLAAALGLPTLALWGPSNPRIWRPLGERARILKNRNGLIGGLTVETVWNELQPLIQA